MAKKKRARDMTTAEAIEALFPKKVIKRLREALLDDDDRPKKKAGKRRKSKG
jgi:hypothetical protein